jgi:KDO2-lipid IV(A) lauroyltransferase
VLNILLYTVLRLASRLLQVLPAPAMYGLARLAGVCAFFLVRGAREGITGNLAVALGTSAESKEVRSAARSAFQNDAMNWFDTLRIGRLSLDEVRDMVVVDDWPLLASALEAGRGVILVTLHLGNFDLVGQALSAQGYRLTVPVERMRPHRLFDFLVKQRTRNGIHLVPVEHASRDLVRALRAGEMVGLAGDRSFAGKTVSVPVFGKTAQLPVGPVSLARRAGCPLLFAVGIRESPGRFRGVVRPVPIADSGDATADDVRNLESFVTLMEETVRRFPGQWLAFRPFWNDDSGEKTAATIGQQKRAAV